MPKQTRSAQPSGAHVALNDLGPLAWVLNELRKSLDAATKAIRRYVREAEQAKGSDLGAIDASQLRMSRQLLHQAVGALEMVGFTQVAIVLRAMEAVAHRFVDHPEICDEIAAIKVERAAFALIGYLEAVLAGKTNSAVTLFAPYAEVQEIAGTSRVHPADLWAEKWQWLPIPSLDSVAIDLNEGSRAAFDKSALIYIKTGDLAACSHLAQMSAGIAEPAGLLNTDTHFTSFWRIGAAFFQALSTKSLLCDIYVKRTVSRMLVQLAAHMKGDATVSDRLAQDLLFFCAQAQTRLKNETPWLTCVREVYALDKYVPIDYSQTPYGHFDPAVLVQVRKRISTVKEAWSALTAGDVSKLRTVCDQFELISDSMTKLVPQDSSLSRTLTDVGEMLLRLNQAPDPSLGMEVATAILYLEAGFEEFDPADADMGDRVSRLAERIEYAQKDGQSQPLESWMEELYRRVSDRQTMGSVVGELKVTLGELEKSMDAYFRDPLDKVLLADVPARLMQMRGVLSVLGLDQASMAVMHMRDSVEEILIASINSEQMRLTDIFDKLGNNLGALGFLIDMLSYQPVLAKRLFVFDEVHGELRPLMGRSEIYEISDEHRANSHIESVMPSISDGKKDLSESKPDARGGVSSGSNTPLIKDSESIDPELLEIFLEEAREVTANGLMAVQALMAEPNHIGELSTLRRVFHTLKGSSRMVGLHVFGEAAWAMEQVLNSWLAEQKLANEFLTTLSTQSLNAMAHWVNDIAAGEAHHWSASTFCRSADALRLHDRFEPLALASEGATIQSQQQSAAINASIHDSVESNSIEMSAEIFSDSAVSGKAHETSKYVESENDIEQENSSESLEIRGELSEEQMVFDHAKSDLIHDEDLASFERSTKVPQVASALSIDEVEVHSESFAISGLCSLEVEAPRVDGQISADSKDRAEHKEYEAAECNAATLASGDTEHAESLTMSDDSFKEIGSLRISQSLYNVYLNEADEWSRRLETSIEEWSMVAGAAIPHEAVTYSHSLAGSSAAVGFKSLFTLARALEHAMQHIQILQETCSYDGQQHVSVFLSAAHDIRHLLHQFAAGFLKEPSPSVEQALAECMQISDMTLAHQSIDAGPIGLAGAALDASLHQSAEKLNSTEALVSSDKSPVRSDQGSVQPYRISTISAAKGDVTYERSQLAKESGSLSKPNLETSEIEDEIDLIDSIEVDLFEIFEDEVFELFPKISNALRLWRGEPQNLTYRTEILRGLHTLKGSARMAGVLRLGEMAHRMESAIEEIPLENLTTDQIDRLQVSLDGLASSLEKLFTLHGKSSGSHMSADAGPSEKISESVENLTKVTSSTQDTDAGSPAVKQSIASSSAVTKIPASAVRSAGMQTVRVRALLLDRLVNQAGEVIITRTKLETELQQLRGSLSELTGNLNKLRTQLRDLEVQAESQMQSRLQQSKETDISFDPLEFDRYTRVQELTRMMAEAVNDVATVQRNIQRTVEDTENDLIAQERQTRDLQRDLLRTRMVEFEGISERLYRVVRQAAKESGKQVRLDISGGSVEMDRGVLERMTPAFEHLLRNCVAHGIETPDLRVAGGKEPNGLIGIYLRQEGNDISIEFRDDGAGLNIAHIKEKAISLGLKQPDQELTEQEAADLIFTPGFSTAQEVTELAGRGIGMDVVRSELLALGGRIETASLAGKGVNFKLVLPLTTAVTQVVMIRISNLAIGVPTGLVELVRRVSPRELQDMYNSGTYQYGVERLPFFWAGSLLQFSRASDEVQGKSIPVIIFQSAAQKIAVHVDEVLGNQEVVVKNLGPQLSRMPGLAGMSVMASGTVSLIYNPVALAAVYGDKARLWSADPAQPHVLGSHAFSKISEGVSDRSNIKQPSESLLKSPLILVVDDSITVRRVTQRLLQREGYRVTTAADGLQALESLTEEMPIVVLSDIEMPRMDGFDLARNIRSDEKFKSLPIIMITSRIAEKHRDHAVLLGVNHYLGKPYSEDELLSLISHYVNLRDDQPGTPQSNELVH